MRWISFIVFSLAFALLVLLAPAVSAAGVPTVPITDYKVTPSVLMPDRMATITVTIKNTASSASLSERTWADNTVGTNNN